MNRDDIIRMAREAGLSPTASRSNMLAMFAALVAAAEREACAKVCMAVSSDITLLGTAAECVNAIRARGQQ